MKTVIWLIWYNFFGVMIYIIPQIYFLLLSVPAPLRPLFRRSRNSTIYAGTNFSLTCIILPNITGLDTDFTVESVVTGPGTSQSSRVSISQQMPVGRGVYEIIVTYSLLLEDDIISHNCSTRIYSPQTNVLTSEDATVSETINVERE